MKIKKAVIPVAGKGTRFLPATKEIPKEMIPILDRPMIHYAVEEAVLAGIEQIIFVTSSGKESIENYFDRNAPLESFLLSQGKVELCEKIQKIGSMVEVLTVRQKEQLGLGHAVLCAKNLIGNESFAVILGDDLVLSEKPVTKQLIEASEKNFEKSVIGVIEVPQNETSRYGIIDGQLLEGESKTFLMRKMIEKPLPEVAPSNLATPGRYVLTPEIFDFLEKIPRGINGEYQLTDAINLLAQNDKVYAHLFSGDRFDTGQISGHLNAVVHFALRSEETKEIMSQIIRNAIREYNL